MTRRYVVLGVLAALAAGMLSASSVVSGHGSGAGSSTDARASAITTGGVAAEAASRYWVGKVRGSRAYIAIAHVGADVLVYACDDDGARKGSISVWFTGGFGDGSLDLRSRSGVRLRASLGAGGVYTGELIFGNGRNLRFAAGTPRRKATFVWVPHTDQSHADKSLFDGFIQLPDGTDRGKGYGPAVGD